MSLFLSRRLLALAVGLGALAGCEGTSADEDSATTDDALSWRGGSEIRIAKSALGREYLLQASLIDQELANFSFGMESKIVRFVVQDKTLLMLETGDGRTNGASYEKALARFPIVFNGTRSIGFDFDAGMRNAFAYSADWHISDDYFAMPFDKVPFELKESFIASAGNQGNRFVIEQAAQLDVPGFIGDVRYPEVIKYYLVNYRPNPSYVPMASPGHDIVSYFEAAPRYQADGDLSYNVTRFDAQKPIGYWVSAAVPPELRDAVKDGVRYWNTVMGREIVRVQDAPANVHAPDLDRNIIEWIDWEDAGFAYADAQVDPRTGETLHAQVFLTSSWGLYAKSEIFQMIAKLATDGEPATDEGDGSKQPAARLGARAKSLKAGSRAVKALGVRGKYLAQREGYADERAYANHLRGLNRLIESGATEAILLEAARDVIRTVVAHEVGHTLGLRHNFAGSTSTTYGSEDVASLSEQYVRGEGRTPEGVRPASTVMDYGTTLDDFLIGDLIEQEVALPYDEVAMKALYAGGPITREGTPAVCNDTAWGYGIDFWGLNYVDCNLWDGGKSIVDSAVMEKNNFLSAAVSDVITRAVAYKTDPDKPRPVGAVVFEPGYYGALAVFGGWTSNLGFAEAFSLFYDTADIWGPAFSVPLTMAQQLPSYPNIGELERDDLVPMREELLLAELERFGGMSELVAPIGQDWVDAQVARLDALLAEPTMTSGLSPRGVPYSLTSEELDVLRAKGRELLAAIPKYYFSSMVAALTLYDVPRGGAGLPILAEGRARLARDGVFAATHEVLTATVTVTSSTGVEITNVVQLPVPLYSQADRIAAADLLGGESPETGWLNTPRDDLIAEIDDLVLTTFGIPRVELSEQLDAIEYPARRWVEDLLAIAGELEGLAFF